MLHSISFPQGRLLPIQIQPLYDKSPIRTPCNSEGRITATLPAPPQHRSSLLAKKPKKTPKKKQKRKKISLSPSQQSRFRGCGKIFHHYLKLQNKILHMPAQLLPALVNIHHLHLGPAGSGPAATAPSSGALRTRINSAIISCSFCTQTTIQNIIKYDCATNLFVFLLYYLRSAAGSYGTPLLKAVRLSEDINDVLIPDPSLMPFLSGLCHQCKDEFFLLYLKTYLHFRITTSNRVFSPRKTFRRIMFHISNPGGIRL